MLISEVRLIERRYHKYRVDVRDGQRCLMPINSTTPYQTAIIGCLSGSQHQISQQLPELMDSLLQLSLDNQVYFPKDCQWAAYERQDLWPAELWVYSIEYVMGNCVYPYHAFEVQAELFDMRFRTSPHPAST